ncbi:hypothetical protein CP970_37655 [Streptomyces kanamyceticus]|uniref:Uncharacterized protein n=2 Tax=Streptomyces kanamyceticus TaxID=1967 RepID=A0A5J6GPG6_STRKN|nr:hypothetical protein CP970_37655 [Streptomyces kanamyceticus]
MLGVPTDAYMRDPLTLAPTLQNYVSRLPLEQFEQSDWATLHSDLTSFLADVLVRRHGATWQIANDPDGPLGFRYVIEAQGLDGSPHRVDPADVVLVEFRELPIEIIRMLANAELTLKLTRKIEEE